MDFVFVGFMADDQRIQSAFSREAAPQVSAVKFQKGLLSGLAERARIRIVGTLPIASFPKNKCLWIAPGHFVLEWPTVDGRLLPMLNLPLIKLLCRLFGGLFIGWQFCRTRRPDAILVYALHTPYVAVASILSSVYRVPFAVFIPDLPLHMARQEEKGLRGFLKRLDNRLLQRLVSRAKVAFPITSGIAEDWLPNSVRYCVIEGVTSSLRDFPEIQVPRPERKRLLYTGNFSQVAHFARMFAESPEIDAECIFIGGGAEADELKRLASEDPRITVKPFMPEASLQDEFKNADILLNPRDTRWEGARYSFPSKLMDYMARGLPVISTRLAGIPPEYFDVFFELDDTDRERLSISLQTALQAEKSEYVRRVAIGYEMLKNVKSPHAVADRIVTAVASC